VTTFRTSRGTIVNVEAPEIVIPPGLVPEDLQAVWQSGGAGREALAKSIFRVLTKNDMASVLPGCVGVGSPFIVHDPDTFQPQMLFTAWTDPAGLIRSVWVADIDEDLRVTNIRQIAKPDLFGVTGLTCCTAFWDDYNEEWVFATTAYGAPKRSYGYFIFFDKNWNIKSTQVIDFAFVVTALEYVPDLGDAGMGLVPHWDKGLTVSCGYDADRSLYYIDDYTQRPLPTPTRGLPIIEIGTTHYYMQNCSSYMQRDRDVHQLFVYNGQLVMLSEVSKYSNLWSIEVLFGPEKDWYKIGDTNMLGKFHMPAVMEWSHGTPNYTHATANQLMHPHYTSLLGRPLLFYITCPYWNAGGSRRYAHEIWAQKINPEEAFNPAKNFPLYMGSVHEPYRLGKVPIPTFGAKTATILLYGVDSSGTLTIIESASPYHIWAEDATRVQSTESISAGANKIIWNRPAPYIALKTDVALSEWGMLLQ